MYKDISKQAVQDFEAGVRKYWDEIDLLKLSVTTREGKPNFVWYEGPPTANGRPGIHHVISRALKDAPLKYKTMKGYKVVRKAGWDTHGLPVELEVEKALGFNDKSQIEEYGIAEFCDMCRSSVFKYEQAWRELTQKMGFLLDLDNAYFTLDNNYIETEWWILDKVFKENLIYEGHKILPYCPRCGTGLASHEVAQGYKESSTITVVCKFKAKDEDAYFLAWTTTPWTLAANVALAVNPDESYIKIKHSNGDIYYLSEVLADKVIDGEYEVLERLTGKDLEHRPYEQLMPFVKPDKEAFYIINADFVTTEDGTGIVHIAPAFGEDDYNISMEYGLPFLQPVDEKGIYNDTPWKGLYVSDESTAVEILKWLAAENKLYSKLKMKHNYPHCWRCQTPLLYYAKKSWYIKMTELKDTLIENNNSIKWHPSYVGEKRFGNWLENLNDWAISRSRYWGTPLNIWRCSCGHTTSVGSRKELVERAIEQIDEKIELHKPYIDDVHLKCDKCGGTMTRVTDVLDCWFDSGSMPFAQHHYPFENKEEFENRFPADYICEGVDQTRGWFYSLLAVASLVNGKAPFKEVLVNDLILDKEGKKMSKSRGNTVDPLKLIDDYGADAVRWYMHYVSPAWLPTKFDVDALIEISSKFFGTLKNTYAFFSMYANTDGLDVSTFNIPVEERAEIDRWIISKLNKLIDYVDEQYSDYDMTKVTRAIYEFVVEDLSNWYIRRNRRRFWASELNDDKKAVYQTCFECLITLCKLIAPVTPYISDEIYRNLTGEVSVHLSDFPVSDKNLINEHIEHRMDLVREIVKLGRAARENVKIKIRQPLHKIYVSGEHRDLIIDLSDLITEELNIKEVVFENDLSQYMNFKLKPNFKVLGPILAKKMGLFGQKLSALNQNEYAMKLKAGEELVMELEGEEYKFDLSNIDVNIDAKEGLTVVMENNLFVILDTDIDEALKLEGYAREFVSKIQNMRKQQGFDVADKINIKYEGDTVIKQAVVANLNYILKETLCENIENIEKLSGETQKLNDLDVTIEVSKIS